MLQQFVLHLKKSACINCYNHSSFHYNHHVNLSHRVVVVNFSARCKELYSLNETIVKIDCNFLIHYSVFFMELKIEYKQVNNGKSGF